MKTLKLNSLMRNLTLITAGAFMATLVVLPITTNASDDDDEVNRPAASVATYTLWDGDGNTSVFTLETNDGSMVLTLVEEPAIVTRTFVEDDD